MTDTALTLPDGRTVAYVEEGEGPVALMLIPEAGRDALGIVAHYLVEEAGFHVVRVAIQEAATPAATADDVLAVMDHLGIDHAWIGGHGAGGTAARAAVAAHPERSNGLLLLGVEESDIPLAPLLPVLIVQGADDEVTPPAVGERLQATAPERASVVNIADAGHLFPLSHVFQTAVTIEEYLDWD